MRSALRLTILLSGSALLSLSQTGLASDFGGLGLIKIPSARMANDGELRATVSREDVADIYNISYQATSWLEATFRYSIFNARNYSYSTDGYKDRSYEAKVRILRERGLLPETAIGVRDMLGTGVWEGEYLVASKEWGSFDISAGLGWGRLASRGSLRQRSLRCVAASVAMPTLSLRLTRQAPRRRSVTREI